MAAVPFIDAFLQNSAGNVTRYKGSGGKYYFSVNVVLELSSKAVLFNEVAIPNKMILSTKGAVEFTRGGVCKRGRGSWMAMCTIYSGNDGLGEFAKIVPSCTVLTMGSRLEDEGGDVVDEKGGDMVRVLCNHHEAAYE